MKFLSIIFHFFYYFTPIFAQHVENSFFITPKDFGCIPNEIKAASDNSEKMQEMIDYAVKTGKKITSKGEEKYYISKSLYITQPISIEFNRATLIATDTIDMLVILKTEKNNRLYSGIISGLYLDLNKKAKSGINCRHVVKLHVSDCWIYGVPKNACGVKVEKGAEMFFDNIHIEGGENKAIGVKIDTHDCHFTDCAMINCHIAVDNKGSNFYERIHAWIENGNWIDESAFFRVRGGEPIFLHQCFSDTFDRAFLIENKTSLFISQHKNFHNKNMWKMDITKIHPEIFHLNNEQIEKDVYIVLNDSYIGGLYINEKERQKFSNIKNFAVNGINNIISK